MENEPDIKLGCAGALICLTVLVVVEVLALVRVMVVILAALLMTAGEAVAGLIDVWQEAHKKN